MLKFHMKTQTTYYEDYADANDQDHNTSLLYCKEISCDLIAYCCSLRLGVT